MEILNRAKSSSVALETTILVHGVPAVTAPNLARELDQIAQRHGATGALIGIIDGKPVVGMNENELHALLSPPAPKVNAANLGITIFRRLHGATTVSATLEIAAAAGLRIFATGGIGGIHRNYAHRLDVSSDLLALARFPVAVVASGVKSILDVAATREALEALGVPLVGFRTDTFPAFYLRETDLPVDARFDDAADLAAFIEAETVRSKRGVLIANPVPEPAALALTDWERWLSEAMDRTRAAGVQGRNITPSLLAHLHEVSGGATLRANLALVKSNVELGAKVCAAMAHRH